MDTHSLTIEFLFLDREHCGRCRDTERNLLSAIESARSMLAERGTVTTLRSVHVTSAQQARQLGFVSSPTIRVNGHDIATRLVETTCEADSCVCADGEPIDCRMWDWEGELHAAPPVDMIARAIVDAARTEVAVQPLTALPDNLERFFAGPGTSSNACCGAQEQASCCEPAAKADCCGGTEAGACGCR